MRRHIPVTTRKLEELRSSASEVIQKNAEAVGILNMIEESLQQSKKRADSEMVWALRASYRMFNDAIEDAAHIIDTIEQFEEIK